MGFRSVKYYISQTFSGMGQNGLMTFISITTVTFCLMLLGIAILFAKNLESVSTQLQTQYEIMVYVKDGTDVQTAQGMKGRIETMPGIKEAIFVSKEEALENFKESIGESDELFEGLDNSNPLRHGFRILLANLEATTQVEAELRNLQGIEKVVSRTDTLNKILMFTKVTRNISILAMLIFTFIAVFIISNTIKLAVMARKREINIMKLVGATDWFIRWPFIIEGAFVGLCGAIVAYVPILIGYNGLYSWWINFWSAINLVKPSDVGIMIFIVFILAGCFIGSTGSLLSVRKYLDV